MLERAHYIRDMQQRPGASSPRPKHRLQPHSACRRAVLYFAAAALSSEVWGPQCSPGLKSSDKGRLPPFLI
jgi:hypothetical protein